MTDSAKLLLYDDNCPLCSWYTRQFVRCGLIRPESRFAFSRADSTLLQKIDPIRGRDEIPYYDPGTGKTVYGLDALLQILGHRLPWIDRVGQFPPVHWFLLRCYRLISYNRKLIVAKKCQKGKFDCSPGFNLPYRIAFLALFLVLNSFLLYPIHNHLFGFLPGFTASANGLQTSHLVFALVNCLSAIPLTRLQALEYLGQVNLLAIITVILLLILASLHSFFNLPATLLYSALGIITAIVLSEYFRRMRYAGIIPGYPWLVITNGISLLAFVVYLFH